MALKIGDRVRFLNSTGGGVVSKFINKDLVSILEDDGFETPALIRECVLVENVNDDNNLPVKAKTTVKETINYTESQPVQKAEKPVELFEETPEGEKLTVALAFVPQDIKNLQTTTYNWYFVNDSNYSLYYTISTVVKEKANVIESGIVHLNTTAFLRKIEKEQLNDFEKINVQFVAFKSDKAYDIKPAISLTIKNKLVNFYKLHSFAENDYFDEPSMLVPVITNDRLELPLNINADEFNMQQLNKDREERRPAREPKKEKNAVIEVDLHIHELLDNTTGLNPADMLEYQLKKFNETLTEYKNKKGQRIVFIHGKGNGVLRNELLRELKKKFPGFTHQDASFKEYGFGATMITVK